MRRSIHALLCAFLAIAGITAALSDQYPVRATTTPPTVGAACNATYQMGIYIEISSGDEYYCDVGLWAKRAAGGGTAPDLWKTIDTPSGTDLTADNTADTLIFAAGTGISITGDGTNTVTIASTGGGGDWVTKGIDLDGNGTNAQLEYDSTLQALLGTPDADGTPNFKWVGGAVPKFYVGSNLTSAYSFFTETAFFGSLGLGVSSYQEQLFLADADGTDNGGYDNPTFASDRIFRFMTTPGNTGYEFDIDGSLNIVGINPDGDGTVDYKFCVDNGGASGEVLKMGGSNCIAWGSDLGGNIDFDVDGTYEVEADGTSVKIDPASDGTPAWKFCEDTPSADEVAYYDSAAGCWKAQAAAAISAARPYQYVELFEDFLRPTDASTAGNSPVTLRVSNVVRQESTDLGFYDYDGTTNTEANSGIGVMGLYTGTTNNNDAWVGFSTTDAGSAPSSLTISTFQVKKARLFRARWNVNFIDGTENTQLVVGGIGETEGAAVSVAPDGKETGVYFFCSPDADIDDDGTAGDAQDDNVWVVVDNNLGNASETACLINGTGACTPDANRTAYDTSIECTDTATANKDFFVGEIEHDGAGNWVFRLDRDANQGTWTYTSPTIAASFANLSSVNLWGVAVRNDNEATGKLVGVDYIYYYGIRY